MYRAVFLTAFKGIIPSLVLGWSIACLSFQAHDICPLFLQSNPVLPATFHSVPMFSTSAAVRVVWQASAPLVLREPTVPRQVNVLRCALLSAFDHKCYLVLIAGFDVLIALLVHMACFF